MSELLNIIDDAVEAFSRELSELPRVNAKEIGLDPRAGYVYVDVDEELIIADHRNIRSLDYYGGFEYVDEDATQTFGDFKIYMTDGEDDRVRCALDFFEENYEDNE